MSHDNDDRAQTRRSVLVVVVVSLAVIAWALFAFFAISERTRTWFYGNAPLTPAQSYSSTQPTPPPPKHPGQVAAPKQVELPSATLSQRAAPRQVEVPAAPSQRAPSAPAAKPAAPRAAREKAAR